MVYFKVIQSGYIITIGTSDNDGISGKITEAEYNEILAVIQNKPQGTETIDYRLKEDLTWEEYEIDPPDPDPDVDDSEVFDILFGGTP